MLSSFPHSPKNDPRLKFTGSFLPHFPKSKAYFCSPGATATLASDVSARLLSFGFTLRQAPLGSEPSFDTESQDEVQGRRQGGEQSRTTQDGELALNHIVRGLSNRVLRSDAQGLEDGDVPLFMQRSLMLVNIFSMTDSI
jgi:hypothetical protein